MSEHLTTAEIPLPRPVEKLLRPDETVQIELGRPLADADEMHEKTGVRGNLVASVVAGGMDFLVVDTRDFPANRDFLILDASLDTEEQQGTQGIKGVNEGTPVVIGRRHHKDRFTYLRTVSSDHFQVLYDNDGLFVQNLQPTNSTRVTAHFSSDQALFRPPTVDPDVYDRRTQQAWERVKARPAFGDNDPTAPYGYFMNHPILGRASPSVDGGVYLGGSAREAIVVDGKSAIMKELYQDVRQKLYASQERGHTPTTQETLTTVMYSVRGALPYDESRVQAVSDGHQGDKLVGLSTFIHEHAGVCRHHSLLSAYLVENLIADNVLSGKTGIERNSVRNKGAHGWAVFKPEDNSPPIVIDATQYFVGTKAQARQAGRWNYSLRTD